MASSPLLRSAGLLLRRPITRGSLPRSPRVFLSGVAGGIEPCKVCGYADTWLDKTHPVLSAKYERIQTLLEKGKRYEREQELKVKISCLLLPAVAALWIFPLRPDKKGEPSSEGQSSN